MASSPPQWAEASERSNNSRRDLPSTYVLRLTGVACGDLGIDPPDPGTAFADQHELVQKFADTFKDPAAIDSSGKPFAQMPGKGVFRIRRGEWRGLVWADRGAGVVWLCGAANLADFPDEGLLYNHLAARGDLIFPTEEERENARDAQLAAHALRALRDAMQAAHDAPETWHEARMRGGRQSPGGGELIGRAYVERVADEFGVLVERFMVTVARPPGSLKQTDWLALVMRVFPSQDGEPEIVGRGALPDGIDFKPGREVALVQQPA